MCIKITLLQSIQDIPIYAKTIKELCVKNLMRKVRDPPTSHAVGTFSDLLLAGETMIKYEDLGNPIVIVQIYGLSFPNTLVDLGAAIYILTVETCKTWYHSFRTNHHPTRTRLSFGGKFKGNFTGHYSFCWFMRIPSGFYRHKPKNSIRWAPFHFGETLAGNNWCLHRLSWG